MQGGPLEDGGLSWIQMESAVRDKIVRLDLGRVIAVGKAGRRQMAVAGGPTVLMIKLDFRDAE